MFRVTHVMAVNVTSVVSEKQRGVGPNLFVRKKINFCIENISIGASGSIDLSTNCEARVLKSAVLKGGYVFNRRIVLRWG